MEIEKKSKIVKISLIVLIATVIGYVVYINIGPTKTEAKVKEETKLIFCGEARKYYRCVKCGADCGVDGHWIEFKEIEGKLYR